MMRNLLCYEESSLLWYILHLKRVYDKCGYRVVQYFRNLGVDAEEYEILCLEKLENLPECTSYDYIYEEYEDSDEHGDAYGEKWIYTSKEMREYYSALTELKSKGIIDNTHFDSCIDEMIDYLIHMVVDKQYNDGGFYCYFDDGTESGEECRIEIYRYFDGSFTAFDVVCGIIAVFEKYKEKLKYLKDTYMIKNVIEMEEK